jgi:hypothetical protein
LWKTGKGAILVRRAKTGQKHREHNHRVLLTGWRENESIPAADLQRYFGLRPEIESTHPWVLEL